MAYVNVAEWKPEQVTEWLKGLDDVVLSYIHSFLNNEVSGQQLLNLRPDDLDHLGVHKLGHQEIILEAVEHLRNFHYELDRENLQLLALRLACRAHSLHNELAHTTESLVTTQTLADVAHIITAVKPLVCWLDGSPFSGQLEYQDRKSELLKLSLEIATVAHRDRFSEAPVAAIREFSGKLAEKADSIIQDITDPLILQPASLDLATLKKRAGDDLGILIVPSFHGVHQIAEIKYSSPAHSCGKIEEGDEVVQVNYQTVVGWQTKQVMVLFEECPTDVFLTLKKRPRHTKVYGQIYMKPYRLPSKKRAAPYTRWHDNLPSPRPELLTIPDFEMPLPRNVNKQVVAPVVALLECEPHSESSDEDDDSFLASSADPGASPTSMRLYMPKPRVTVQRRATVTGSSPTNKRPPVNVQQFWRELRMDRQWKEGSDGSGGGPKEELYQLRDKSASFGNGFNIAVPPRPSTCLGIENSASLVPRNGISKDLVKKQIKPMENIVESSPVKTPTIRNQVEESVADDSSKALGLGERVTDSCDNDKTDCDDTSSEKGYGTKERGRLDKSYSTPAYDESGPESNDSSPIEKSFPPKTRPRPAKRDDQDTLPYVDDSSSEKLSSKSTLNETINTTLIDTRLPDYHEIAGGDYISEADLSRLDKKSMQLSLDNQKQYDSVQICVTPPEPPPRPSLGLDQKASTSGISQPRLAEARVVVLNTEPGKSSPPGDQAKGGVGFRAMQVAKSLGRNANNKSVFSGSASLPSPRSVRKKNALLAKRRNVSVTDVGAGEVEGWLFHRQRSSGANSATWHRGWFVLRAATFYGFNTQKSARAHLMIALPGFTATLAQEVKSRKYAFKVYHTGTVFYFAVETEEELTLWLESISAATIRQEISSNDAVVYSESDEGSDSEMPAPSPKVRKFAGFLSHSNSQQLITESKSSEIQKKFGSLKKLGRKQDAAPTSPPGHDIAASSLDRKYLRIFGSRNNVPVPTAQFRSYRRSPAAPRPADAKPEVSSQFYLSAESVFHDEEKPAFVEVAPPSYETVLQRGEFTVPNVPPPEPVEKTITVEFRCSRPQSPEETFRVAATAARVVAAPPKQDKLHSRMKNLDYRERQIHASNPSLLIPSDMSDYRMAAERLREFGIRRNRQREDTSGFVTLEEFMLSRQEEERKQRGHMTAHSSAHSVAAASAQSSHAANANQAHSKSASSNSSHAHSNHAHTNSGHAHTNSNSLSSHSSHAHTNSSHAHSNSSHAHSNSNSSSSHSSAHSSQGIAPVQRKGSFNSTRIKKEGAREYRGGSPEKFWIDSLRRNDASRKPISLKNSQVSDVNSNQLRLKHATQYQPPPMKSSGGSSHDEPPKMKLAFEMQLDKQPEPPHRSKFRSLFSSSKSQQKQHLLDAPPVAKTFLGSPRLHRAVFGDRKVKNATSDSSSSSLGSPASPPFDWPAESFSSQSERGSAPSKPTMGVQAMLGKIPSRRNQPPSPSPSQSSPPPDYPGLEYPPVFEPETYTLTDANTLMRATKRAMP